MTKKLIVFIFLIGFLVYTNSLFNNFVWDDEEQVVNNPYIRSFTNLPTIFKGGTFSTGGAGLSGWYYKPLMSLWFTANYAVFGLRPFGFHLSQVSLHLVNSILIFLIFNKLFISFDAKIATLAAFFSALIFAVHPTNVESVAYVASTQEILYTFFLLLALNMNSLFLAVSFFFFSLLSKESAVIGIPLIFLYLWLIKNQKKTALGWLIGSGATFLFYFFLRTFVARIPLSPPRLSPIANASLTQRLVTIPFEIFSYLRLIFFPLNLSIAQHQVIKDITDIRFWGAALPVVVVFLSLIWLLFKLKEKLAWFFFFWFIGSLTLVLNIFPLDMTIAERWLYFPLIGFLGLTAVLFLQLKNFNKIFIWLLVIIVLLFPLRTVARTFDWRNGLTLFSHDARITRDSFDLENNLGVELFRAGKVAEAKPHFEKSIKLQPAWWTSFNNSGVVYQQEGNLEKAKELYQRSITNGDYYLAYENLGRLMLKTDGPEETIKFLTEALGKFPLNGNLRASLALAYYQKEDFVQAEKSAREAVILSPTEFNKLILLTIIQRKPIEY